MLCQCKGMATRQQRGLQLALASGIRALRLACEIHCARHQMCILAGRKRKGLCTVLAAQLRLPQAVKQQVIPLA